MKNLIELLIITGLVILFKYLSVKENNKCNDEIIARNQSYEDDYQRTLEKIEKEKEELMEKNNNIMNEKLINDHSSISSRWHGDIFFNSCTYCRILIVILQSKATKDKIIKSDANSYNSVRSDDWHENHTEGFKYPDKWYR